MRKIKKESIILLAVVILITATFYFFNIGCIWKKLFGIECPTCGMTRAWKAMLRGDIRAAFEFHPLFFTIPILWAYILFDGKLLKNEIANIVVLITIFVAFFIVYIIRLVS